MSTQAQEIAAALKEVIQPQARFRPEQPRKKLEERWTDPETGQLQVGHLSVRFYDHPKLDMEASAEAGHPVYGSCIMGLFKVNGSKEQGVSHLIVEDDLPFVKATWPAQWASYETGEKAAIVGTNLKALGLTVGDIKTLEGRGINTVEGLSGISDADAASIRKGLEMRGQALRFLEERDLVNQGNVLEMVEGMKSEIEELQKVRAENERLKSENHGLKIKAGKQKAKDGDPDTPAAG